MTFSHGGMIPVDVAHRWFSPYNLTFLYIGTLMAFLHYTMFLFTVRFVVAPVLAKKCQKTFSLYVAQRGCFSGIDLQPWISGDGFFDVSQKNLYNGKQSITKPFQTVRNANSCSTRDEISVS